MDEILDFVQGYWWIIGIILLRFVFSNARKKKKTESDSASNKKPAQKSQLQEYLEKMRAELEPSQTTSSQSHSRNVPLPNEVPFSSDDDDDSVFLGHRPTPQEQQAQLIEKMRQAQKAKTLAEKNKSFISEIYQPVEKAEISLPAASTPKENFPENLDYLPPLQRAFIFSEIFGTPKGMD